MTKQLEFPKWVPPLLCQQFKEGAYDYNPSLAELTYRLLTYPEMEIVWAKYRQWITEQYPKIMGANDDVLPEYKEAIYCVTSAHMGPINCFN